MTDGLKCQCCTNVGVSTPLHPPEKKSVEKGRSLFCYQAGTERSLAGLFTSGAEWTGLLLCKLHCSAVKWVSGGEAASERRIKTHSEMFTS